MDRLSATRWRLSGKKHRTIHFEVLEPRFVLAVFTVNSTLDDGDSFAGDGICDTRNNPTTNLPTPASGVCTLRASIQQANSDVALDTIRINPATIQPQRPLPTIINSVEIFPSGTSRTVIDGSAAGLFADGLSFTSAHNVITRLVVHRFAGNGIELIGGGNSRIQDIFVGVDSLGIGRRSNGGVGVEIVNSPGNLITRSVISGNGDDGIQIFGVAATGNTIRANEIGTALGGAQPLGNGDDGIFISDAANNIIGGSAQVAGRLGSTILASAAFVQLPSEVSASKGRRGTRLPKDAASAARRGQYVAFQAQVDRSARLTISSAVYLIQYAWRFPGYSFLTGRKRPP